MNSLFCGIDFHKNSCTLCFLDENGKEIELTKKLTTNVVSYLSNYGNLTIAVEASGGVNAFVDKLKASGHFVKIVDPKAFRLVGLGGKKSDKRDARALAKGLQTGFIPEVHHKSRRAREIKSLLVSREITVHSRVNIFNHIRGTLREYGITIPQGKDEFLKHAVEAINKVENGFIRATLMDIYNTGKQLMERELEIEKRLDEFCKTDDNVKRLQTVPGIGKLSALAFVAVIDDHSRFKNAKLLGSYLGLVPREFSSGDKVRMGRVTKSGPEILRRYLIHGARAVMKHLSDEKKINDPNKLWALKLKNKVGMNKATVALAHRMARIGFCLLRDQTSYEVTKKVVLLQKNFNAA